MNARGCFVCFALFGFAAALGAGFAVFGPVAFVRVLGVIAFLGGALGSALQLYALREFAPRAHVLLQRKIRGGFQHVAAVVPATRTVMASPR
jgi:hypothetical protein